MFGFLLSTRTENIDGAENKKGFQILNFVQQFVLELIHLVLDIKNRKQKTIVFKGWIKSTIMGDNVKKNNIDHKKKD